jgi:hypothetical protein
MTLRRIDARKREAPFSVAAARATEQAATKAPPPTRSWLAHTHRWLGKRRPWDPMRAVSVSPADRVTAVAVVWWQPACCTNGRALLAVAAKWW